MLPVYQPNAQRMTRPVYLLSAQSLKRKNQQKKNQLRKEKKAKKAMLEKRRKDPKSANVNPHVKKETRNVKNPSARRYVKTGLN